MSDHVLNRGLDIPIKGRATGDAVQLETPNTAAYAPTELRGIVPRMAVREGDTVKSGSVLFYNKAYPAMVFRSPLAGSLTEIRRGKRRVITDVVVEGGGEGVESFRSYSSSELATLSRPDAVEAILATGLWAHLRTRPLDKVAHPEEEPQSIFIGAMDTGPLQLGATALLADDDGEALQAAVNALSNLTDGKIFLCERSGAGHPALSTVNGVERHAFRGPHPAGDPSVQINLVDPPRGSGQVWYLRAWEAVLIGNALLSGTFPVERTYAAVGAGVASPRIVKTILGAPMSHIVGETTEGPQRWIRGSVLSGEAVDAGRWASFSARAVHVLPNTVPRSILGWALPALGNWSFHKAFLSGFTKATREYDLRPGLFGGERAMVPVGFYGKVVATPDILVDFLFKAIISGDLEESIKLGLLDLSQEEAALCTFICPSKIEFDVILREGLDLYEAEA
jgi:Na+-transporting NADH:ubiquinone oxidoreductase subunit A